MKPQTNSPPSRAAANDAAVVQRIFISYNRADRERVDGLANLLEAMGHSVFVDRRTIKLGKNWETELEEALDEAEMMLVFWTRHAAESEWVQREYELFARRHHEGLVPVLGDETPLPAALAKIQASDFVAFINELLAIVRREQELGSSRKAIQKQVLARLREAGIEIGVGDRKKLFYFLGSGGLAGALAAPLAISAAVRAVAEGALQLTAAQLAVVGLAAVTGATVCQVTHQLPPVRDLMGIVASGPLLQLVEGEHRLAPQTFEVTHSLQGPGQGGIVGREDAFYRAEITVAPRLEYREPGLLRIHLSPTEVTTATLEARDPTGLAIVGWKLELSAADYPYQWIQEIRAEFDGGSVVIPPQFAGSFHDIEVPSGSTRLLELQVDFEWIDETKTIVFD